MSGLTDTQTQFVEELVSSGCTPTEAARRSGYADPGQEAWRLMRKDHVVAAIRTMRERMVSGHAANVAIKTLVEIMTDKAAPASARVSAARTVCEAAGDFDRAAHPAQERRLEEMTTEQLVVFISSIDRTTGHLAARSGEHVIEGSFAPVQSADLPVIGRSLLVEGANADAATLPQEPPGEGPKSDRHSQSSNLEI
jgi:hypothetical protein